VDPAVAALQARVLDLQQETSNLRARDEERERELARLSAEQNRAQLAWESTFEDVMSHMLTALSSPRGPKARLNAVKYLVDLRKTTKATAEADRSPSQVMLIAMLEGNFLSRYTRGRKSYLERYRQLH